MVTIAIIGTCGRKKRFTAAAFAKTVEFTRSFLAKYQDVNLVSGGTAGADHIIN